MGITQEQEIVFVEFDSNRGKIYFAAISIGEVLMMTNNGKSYDGWKLGKRKIVSEEEVRKQSSDIELYKLMLGYGITCVQLR